MVDYSKSLLSKPDNAPFIPLYNLLRSEPSIKDTDLDIGYRVANTNGTLCPNRKDTYCTVGKGDHTITPQEVLDAGLVGSQVRAEYRNLVEEIIHQPLPWSLYYHDPQTSYETDVRNRVLTYNHFLDDFLIKNGFKEGTPKFVEAKSVGIFYFVIAPDKESVERQLDFYGNTSAELDTLGWTEVKNYLRTNGGLFTRRGNKRLPTLKALEQGELNNNQVSMILYAALKASGISAELMTGEGVATGVFEDISSDVYICVRIPVGKKWRMMDPDNDRSDVRYNGFVPTSERQVLALYAILHGNTHNSLPADQLKTLNLSQIMDPSSALIHGMLAIHWGNQEKWNEAFTEADKGIALAPNSSKMHLIRGALEISRENYDSALKSIARANDLAPARYDVIIARIAALTRKGDWDTALQDIARLCHMTHGKLLEQVPSIISQLTVKLWSGKDREGLRKTIKAEIGIDASEVEASIIYPRFLWEEGRPKTALALLKESLLALPHPETYSEPVRNELHRLIAILPPAMREDKETGTAIARIP